MKLQKHLPVIALVTLLGVAGCGRRTANQNTGSVPAATPGSQAQGGVVATTETRFFKGSIGDALDLQMKLVRDGDRLSGSYFYQKVGKKIDVRGGIDKDTNVSLDEFDANGKQTGVFKGVWKQAEDGSTEITGNWSRPNGDKKAEFSLLEMPIELSHGVEIVPRKIKETNKKLKYEIDVTYPQLTGSTDPNFEKFNQTVRSLMNRKVSDFKKEMTPTADEPAADPGEEVLGESLGSDITTGYEVALARDDLIAIEFTVSSYSAGAAHPNSYTEVVNFDLKNGRQIKLAELFVPGAKYVQSLSAYSIQELKKKAKAEGADTSFDEDWIQKGAGPESSNFDNWAITRKGLRITFDPYQVGPYAAGPQQVVVPYSAIKEIIKADGLVGQFGK